MADANILYPTAEIWTESPHRAYGLMLTPNYTIHDDFDAIFDQTGCKKIGCYIDHNARVLMGRPIPVLKDTKFGSGIYNWTKITTGGNTANWHDDVIDPDTGKRCLLMDDANKDVFGLVVSDWIPDAGTPYTVKITKGRPPADATHDGDNCFFIFYLGYDEGSNVLYRINAPYGKPFVLEGSFDSGVTFQTLRSTENIPDCEAYLESHDRICTITVIPFPTRKTISIYIGALEGDLSYTDQDILFPNDNLSLVTKNGKCALTYFPIGFPIAWSFRSGSKELGFTPRVDPQPRLWPDGTTRSAQIGFPATIGFPAGAAVGITVIPDPAIPAVISYLIEATGTQEAAYPTGLGLDSVRLEWAQIDYPGVSFNDTFSIPLLLNPRRVCERHIFDWNNLNLVRQATILCDNFHAEWSYSSGMRACSLARGYNGINELGFVGWLGETIRYSRADPDRSVTFQAFDRSFPLRRRRCGVQPPQDGWCVNASIRYWAQLGGVTDEWLAYIPNCRTGPGPLGCNHPLLPIGTGSRPRMKADYREFIWSQMNRIRQMYRYILGFDRYGFLRFEPYDPTNGDFYGVFTLVPEFTGAGDSYLNELTAGIEVTASVQDVRSEVTLIGINPGDDWSPIIAHVQNPDVVYNLASPAFLGFPDPWVEVDPIFTNLAFMRAFAEIMIAQTSIPTVSSDFGGYLQPNMHLFDRFGLSEPVTIGDAEMYASSLTHTYAIGGAEFLAQSIINGKSVENIFG